MFFKKWGFIGRISAWCSYMGLFTTFLYHRYYLKRIHQVKLKPGLLYGDRYLVDLELGIKHKGASYRFSEHVYQKKGSSRLCSPKSLTWNKAAIAYFILPVKDQGEWVYHFINEITAASLLSKDENFHVIVVDFESQDISISQAYGSSPQQKHYHKYDREVLQDVGFKQCC